MIDDSQLPSTEGDISLARKQSARLRLAGGSKKRAAEKNLVVRLMKNDADIEATWELYQSFHAESRYQKLPADKALRTKSLRRNFLENPKRYGFFIAELEEKPVGFLSCMLTRLLYTEYRSASVLGLYVLPSCRRTLAGGRVTLKLLSHYRAWAKRRRAVEIQVHVTHGFELEHTNKFFTRMGFRLCGGNYSLEI